MPGTLIIRTGRARIKEGKRFNHLLLQTCIEWNDLNFFN